MKALIFPILLLHLFLLSNLNFTAWPEMLSYPYLLSNGFLLYKDYVIPYPPTLTLILSLVFNLFGYHPEVLKYFTWLVVILADVVMYLILIKITKNKLVALFFLTIYIFLQSFFDGNMMWFDNATVLPLLASFLFLIYWIHDQKPQHLILLSFFLCLTITVKQAGIFYALGALAVYLIMKRKIELEDVKYAVLGICLVIVPLFVYLISKGILLDFWRWVIYYPLTMFADFPGYVDLEVNRSRIILISLLFLPTFPLILIFKKLDKILIATLIMLIAAILAVYPRYSFFHLQPTIALLVILYAQILLKIHLNQQFIYKGLLIIITSFLCFNIGRYTLGQGIRFYEQDEKDLAKKIQSETSKNDKIFLLGLSSAQYVYTNRIPSKNWADNFGWYFEIPGIQENLIKGFEQDPPQVIFRRIPAEGEWFKLDVYQPQKVVQHIQNNYELKETTEKGIQIWTKKD